MDEAMSEEETNGQVREWLDRQNADPQCDNHAEPMSRANHGASDQIARERL